MHRYGTSIYAPAVWRTFPPGLIKVCPGMVAISLTLVSYLNLHATVVTGTIYRPRTSVVVFGAKALRKSPPEADKPRCLHSVGIRIGQTVTCYMLYGKIWRFDNAFSYQLSEDEVFPMASVCKCPIE